MTEPVAESDEPQTLRGDNNSELPDLQAKPGSDHCRPLADHKAMVVEDKERFPALHLATRRR